MEGLNYETVFLKDLNIDSSDFVEDGVTFSENACKKARYFGDKAGFLTLAEDSGVLVDALKGELGVKTRRWGAGENATDEEWINYFMKRMETETDRDAKFICSACLFEPTQGTMRVFNGETKGKIANKILAPILSGLPLSSVFIADGMDKAYAELSPSDKNKISHRGKAMNQVKEYLSKS